jgi:hypothetical protein
MDGIEYEIAEYNYVGGTTLLYEVLGPKTINIPLFFLSNPGFADALRIEYINKGDQNERRKVPTKTGCGARDKIRPKQNRVSLFIANCIRKVMSSFNLWR